MKKIYEVEGYSCDFCGKESSRSGRCLRCGKDICWKCRDSRAVEYPHSARTDGSGDGVYCNECNEYLLANSDANPDPLFSAYVRIARLKREWSRFYSDFNSRDMAAEREVERLRKGMGL